MAPGGFKLFGGQHDRLFLKIDVLGLQPVDAGHSEARKGSQRHESADSGVDVPIGLKERFHVVHRDDFRLGQDDFGQFDMLRWYSEDGSALLVPAEKGAQMLVVILERSRGSLRP